jgi:hypothetical protein
VNSVPVLPVGASCQILVYATNPDTGAAVSLAGVASAIVYVKRAPDYIALALTGTVVSEPLGILAASLLPADVVGEGTWITWAKITYLSGAVIVTRETPLIVDDVGSHVKGNVSAQKVRDLLEGYCIDNTTVTDQWIENRRDKMVIPWVQAKTGVDMTTRTDGNVDTCVARVTEFHSGTGSSLLYLDHRGIIQVHSIILVTNPSNWMYVSPTAVEVVADEGILKLRTVLEAWTSYVPAFPRGKYNLKIDYSYGYATLPEDLAEVVNLLVASVTLGLLGGRTGGGSPSLTGYSRAYGERGKYHDTRQELDRWAWALMRKYVSGVTGV